MKGVSLRLCHIAAAVICLCLLYPRLPVNYLTITSQGRVLLASPMSNAGSFTSTYIHSVQLTPVIDDYRLSGGRIWSWEERVMSHNAGLPFEAPTNGRFLVDSPWLIVQGGRVDLGAIAYRVGNSEFGRNLWRVPPFKEIEAYKEYPSQRVLISSDVRELRDAAVIGITSPDLIE